MRIQSGALPILKLHAAGIDMGAREIYVAVPADRDPQPVRCFPTFTEDLQRLADWLQHCGITTVAMESTSVYWIPLYQILEARGLEVCLVKTWLRAELRSARASLPHLGRGLNHGAGPECAHRAYPAE
jgi:transposase